jgi:hypothetical protein
VALALILAGLQVHAQETPPVALDGPEVFGHLLHQFGKLQPVLDPATALDPHKVVIIAFGSLDLPKSLVVGRFENKLSRFLTGGGNLLVAGDTDPIQPLLGMSAVLQPLGLELGLPVAVPASEGYHEQRDCPRIGLDRLPLMHPLFLGLQQDLATNKPRAVKVPGTLADLTVLARLPRQSAALLRQANETDATWRPVARLAARIYSEIVDPIYMVGSPASAPPQRRLLILGGHGMFTNCMLVQDDCDNFTFAINCIRWLREGPDGPRTHALFLVDGKLIERFDLPLRAPAPPIPMPTGALLDRLAADLEDEGFFHKLLHSEPDQSDRLAQGLFITLTILLLLFATQHLLAGRYRAETRVPLLVGSSATVARPPSRQEELLARDNLWEAAQALARAWFHEHGMLSWDRWDGDLGSAEPAFTAFGPFWRRWRLQRHVRHAWDLARSRPAGRVSKRRFLTLARSLAQLSEAVRAGHLHRNESMVRSP